MPRESYNIADDQGGVYGEGASTSSSGPNAKVASAQSDAFSSLDDVFEYMDLQARKGDARATFNLAKLNYDGARTLKRDLPAAKKRFLELARMYWTKDGKINANVSWPDVPARRGYATKFRDRKNLVSTWHGVR